MSKSKLFLYLSLFFIFGIFIRSLCEIAFFYIYIVFLLGMAGAIIFWKNPRTRIIGLALVFIALGIFRYNLSVPRTDDGRIEFYNGQSITFVGMVDEDADIRSDHVKLKIKAENISSRKVDGLVLVKTDLYPQYGYGDQLEIKCNLKKPEKIEDFDYEKYLARYDIYSVCYNPKITLISSDNGNLIIKILYYGKKKFTDVINRILPEPQASLLAGILIGARRGIPEDLMDNFNRTGITHIIAISGYNITIIAALLLVVFRNLFIPRKKAFWLIVACIVVFTFITGASASVVRAGIMGIVVLLAKQIGRASKIFNVLVLVGLVMLLANPKILAFDAGFQLSFLATIGLIYISPILEKYAEKIPEIFGLKEAFLTTLSAIIMTSPLILYQFGRFSVVAPIVNILVLPVIPLAMAVGFIAVIGGLVWIQIGQFIGWAVWFILGYVVWAAEWFGNLSRASIEVPQVNCIFIIVFYLAIVLWYFRNSQLSKK